MGLYCIEARPFNGYELQLDFWPHLLMGSNSCRVPVTGSDIMFGISESGPSRTSGMRALLKFISSCAWHVFIRTTSQCDAQLWSVQCNV